MDVGGVTDGTEGEKEMGAHMQRDEERGRSSDVRERVLGAERERVEGIAMRANGEKGVIASLASHTATTATPQRLGVPFVRS